ncbi:hypothetical protein HPB50_018154 [Hyalomma asiaticum]|uniref:Uncharacterized protein n=1 Tax=Hyalomma asiaticum TaxID=266040 RepID=A0ACB7RVE2_HYAAI|nr:hypothetical protein HPB50_018154 [Hyalomma asiaticum]
MDEKEDTSQASESGHPRWTPGRVYHWVLSFGAFAYALGRFATNEEKRVAEPFQSSRCTPPGNFSQLVPVFYAVYSSLFASYTFGWEVALLFLGQHAAFYLTASMHNTALCYVVAAAIHCQKFFLPFDPLNYMYPRYGLMAYRAAYVTFHWNILRGLSFSVDFVQGERRKDNGATKCGWPSYWKTLGYMLYLPTLYLGPPQKYDEYIVQFDKTRPTCTLREIAVAIARLLRSGAHFLLMELMAHFLYRRVQ